METVEYIRSVKIEEIPWHRMTTAYGRATLIPIYLNELWDMKDIDNVKKATHEILRSIEHQSTLWHATPFAMIFLMRILDKANQNAQQNIVTQWIIKELLDFFDDIKVCYDDIMVWEHDEALPYFDDMIKEDYLWPEDEEHDDERWEDNPFPDNLFYSFYEYSHQVLIYGQDILENAKNSHKSFEINEKRE